MSTLVLYLGRRGAGTAYAVNLIDGLMSNDLPVSTIISCQNETKEDFHKKHIPVHAVNTFSTVFEMIAFLPFRLIGILRAIHHVMKRDKCTAVVCAMHHIWGCLIGLYLRWREIPYVLVVHDAQIHPGDGGWLHQKLLDWHIASASKWVALTNHVAKQLVAAGCDPLKVTVIPLGVYPYYVCETPRDISGKEKLTVTFFGRILEYKGLDLLLDAWPDIVARVPNAMLSICGSGQLPHSTVLETHKDSIMVRNGWIADEDIAAIFRDSDLMVFPYREATQSGVLAIAFPAAIPVVATPIGGLVEQLQYGGGVVCESISVKCIEDVVSTILVDTEKYHELSRAALCAASMFSWKEIAEKWRCLI